MQMIMMQVLCGHVGAVGAGVEDNSSPVPSPVPVPSLVVAMQTVQIQVHAHAQNPKATDVATHFLEEDWDGAPTEFRSALVVGEGYRF